MIRDAGFFLVFVAILGFLTQEALGEEISTPVDDESPTSGDTHLGSTALGDEGSRDAPHDSDPLPEAAARRFRLVEPLGPNPAPWIALSGVIEGGVTVNGQLGWSGVRVHIPVARRYGAVDARLVGVFDGEGLVSLGPELSFRALPLRRAGDRGLLGLTVSVTPLMKGLRPTLTVGGGSMGGYLGERWFVWGFLGARAEVLQGGGAELLGTLAAGLRLPHGLRPQMELDLRWQAERRGEVSFAVRPGFRYWPREWIGIGISADIWVLGPDLETSAIRIDIVGHAIE